MSINMESFPHLAKLKLRSYGVSWGGREERGMGGVGGRGAVNRVLHFPTFIFQNRFLYPNFGF